VNGGPCANLSEGKKGAHSTHHLTTPVDPCGLWTGRLEGPGARACPGVTVGAFQMPMMQSPRRAGESRRAGRLGYAPPPPRRCISPRGFAVSEPTSARGGGDMPMPIQSLPRVHEGGGQLARGGGGVGSGPWTLDPSAAAADPQSEVSHIWVNRFPLGSVSPPRRSGAPSTAHPHAKCRPERADPPPPGGWWSGPPPRVSGQTGYVDRCPPPHGPPRRRR